MIWWALVAIVLLLVVFAVAEYRGNRARRRALENLRTRQEFDRMARTRPDQVRETRE